MEYAPKLVTICLWSSHWIWSPCNAGEGRILKVSPGSRAGRRLQTKESSFEAEAMLDCVVVSGGAPSGSP
jgi:hypothetical protein